MQGTRVRALVQEDLRCRRATKPMRHYYWACALEPMSRNYWACVLQLLKPVHLERVPYNKRSHCNEKPAHHNEEELLLIATRESPHAATKAQRSQKIKLKKLQKRNQTLYSAGWPSTWDHLMFSSDQPRPCKHSWQDYHRNGSVSSSFGQVAGRQAPTSQSQHLPFVINLYFVGRYYGITPISWSLLTLSAPALASVDHPVWIRHHFGGYQMGIFLYPAFLLPIFS